MRRPEKSFFGVLARARNDGMFAKFEFQSDARCFRHFHAVTQQAVAGDIRPAAQTELVRQVGLRFCSNASSNPLLQQILLIAFSLFQGGGGDSEPKRLGQHQRIADP
jgi:hypothetical protein